MSEVLTVTQLEVIKKNLLLFRVPDEKSYTAPDRNLGNENTPICWHKHKIQQNAVIYLQPLSPLPSIIFNVKVDMQEPFVTSDDRNYKGLNSIGYDKVDYDERVNWLKENITNRLILAHPILNKNNNRLHDDVDPFYYNFDIVYISNEKPESSQYRAVPSVVSTLERKRFESLLQKQKQVQFTHYNGVMPPPQFVICENVLYHIPAEAMKPYEPNINAFYCVDATRVTRMEIPPEFRKKSQCTWQGLHFISSDYANKLESVLLEKGIPFNEELIFSARTIATSQPELISDVKYSDIQPVVAKGQISEYEFLIALKSKMINANLFYDENDLHSFHTAVKTNFLTILGGMSGTGKTRLALEYASTLGLKSGEDLLIVPISPSYTEPADVLGYLNPQTGYFVESETGLLRFLYNASQKPYKLYMVIFDEMNLSQVEHWFSPFISILEMDERDRKLKIISDRQCCLQDEYRDGIPIGNNVLLVGTANLDETTKEFSNRLLDRANVIELQKQTFLDAKHTREEAVQVKKYDTITSSTFRSWVRVIEDPMRFMDDTELTLLDSFHEEIKRVDPQNGVSFRVVRAIANFIANIPLDESRNPLLARSEAFDIQLCQRVFTKVKGHRDMLKDILGTYNQVSGEVEGGQLLNLIQQHLKTFYGDEEKLHEHNMFGMSINSLIRKAKEVAINGYTM